MYTHEHVCTHLRTHTHTHALTHIHTHTHTHTHAHTRTHSRTHAHTHTGVCRHARTESGLQTNRHPACPSAYIHIVHSPNVDLVRALVSHHCCHVRRVLERLVPHVDVVLQSEGKLSPLEVRGIASWQLPVIPICQPACHLRVWEQAVVVNAEEFGAELGGGHVPGEMEGRDLML